MVPPSLVWLVFGHANHLCWELLECLNGKQAWEGKSNPWKHWTSIMCVYPWLVFVTPFHFHSDDNFHQNIGKIFTDFKLVSNRTLSILAIMPYVCKSVCKLACKWTGWLVTCPISCCRQIMTCEYKYTMEWIPTARHGCSLCFQYWLLVGIMILVSHFSQRFARLLGNNPVSVLATLILLSYTKILHTLIAVLYVTFLE